MEFYKIYASADLVTLPTYDLWTPDQHPEEAFHPAWREHNKEFGSIEHHSKHIHASIDNRMTKTIFAIQTYGRTWKLKPESTDTGIPPIHGLDEPGEPGLLSQYPGLLSYPEICANLPEADNRIVQYDRFQLDNYTNSNGAYAFRQPDIDGNHGIWIGYEDPFSVEEKVKWALEWGLAGAAVVDLSYDDFRGTCGGEKFPILNAVRSSLEEAHNNSIALLE